MMRYVYRQHGNEYGPVDAETLQEMAMRGELSPADPVREEDGESWSPARRVPGLVFRAADLAPYRSQQPTTVDAGASGGATAPPPPSHVPTVRVETPRRGSSLGIAAMVIGVLALLIC